MAAIAVLLRFALGGRWSIAQHRMQYRVVFKVHSKVGIKPGGNG